MAMTSYVLFTYSNGKIVKNSNSLEILFKSVGVSSDGIDNGFSITQGAAGFDFGAKKLTNVASGTASGQALIFDQIGANLGVAGLDSGGKVPIGQLPNSIMELQGSWDASSNLPALADGTGDIGDVYRVSVAGTQDLGSGNQTFVVGDYVIYAQSVWQLSHGGADSVLSVNGQTAIVSLDTDDITEGTNKYFSDTLARNAVIAAAITNGDTTHSPSGDVIYDAFQTEITARQGADSSFQSSLDFEITARQDADTTLQNSLDSEITARQDADTTLQNSLESEITARQDSDTTLQNSIDSEITARQDADTTLQNSIDSEITARQEADTTLQNSLESEITARQDADTTLQNSLDSEITARQDADTTLQNSLESEITARQDADTTLQNSLESEITARQDADTTLQNSLDSEITARQDADTTLQNSLDSEITARQDADTTLQNSLDSEITARQDSDTTLQNSLDSEITARQDADTTLQNSLDSEITARQDADTTLQNSINSEITARSNADSSLQTELDTTQGSIGTFINGAGAWVGFSGTHYLDAELTITTSLEELDSRLYGETTARINADSSLQSQINSLSSPTYTLTNAEASATMSANAFVYENAAGQAKLLTSSASGLNDYTVIGCTKASIAPSSTGPVFLPEKGTILGGFTSLAVNQGVYAHPSTPGGYTQSTGSYTAGDWLILLGKPVSATEILFIGRVEFVYG